ncbi:MAG TPA: bifunctional ornithine acetyltransferase/N-acetylglutamate synthase, partial [Thermoleophilaceae bacterium]|nr:bifunctional ornithine acetyltransferase/N-acetylglutamate synthase [Thermoleophilaceae bacterium]
FFSSRWVTAPDHVRELDPTTLPAGFRAAGAAAGIKPDGLDVGVLFCESPDAVSAARFTTNARVGAPVIVSKESALDRLRAVVANAGCSNVGDGARGLETARAMQRAAAEGLGIEPAQVGVASTGVIGWELPRDKVVRGIGECVKGVTPRQAGESAADPGAVDPAGADAFAHAILTSDSGPKRASFEVGLPSGATVVLAAQAKGAGMLAPRHATMFCFIETDAAMAQDTLDLLTGVCVKRSFDRISVDGQLSTSDTVFAIASGASGVAIEPESPDELAFGEALDALLRQLAMLMVADGEGARRVGRILVRGRPDAIEPVARSIAYSPLVKTALHGADPNFGRILQAAGQAWPPGEPFVVDLEIEGLQVVSAGDAIEVDLDDLARRVRGDEVEYALTIPGSGGETEVYFSDLSPEYVRFNSEYTS